MKQNLLRKFWLRVCMLVAVILCGAGSAWGEEVTYTISSKNTLTTTGTAPTGSNATIVETSNTSTQITSGNSQTLTLSGYNGCTITKLTLSMRSNTSKGAGKLSYSTDGGENFTYIVGSSSAGVAFSNVAWYGKWFSDHMVNIVKDVTISPTTDNFIIKIEATQNSLYCDSYTLTYSSSSSSSPSIDASDVNIAYDATSGSLAYTINNPSSESLTASTTSDWLTLGTVGASPIAFTCSANPGKTSRTATVTLTYGSVTKNVTVTQAGNPNIVDNISDITAAGTYTVKGTIVAKSQRGFIVGDGTGYVYYYNKEYTQADYNIGDKVKLSGSVVAYGGVFEFDESTVITPATESNYVTEAPTILTGSQMDTRVASTTPAQLSTYVQYEGTLSVSGTFYNITNIDGASTAKGSISYPINTNFTSLNGKTVKVTGYYVGVSSSQYYNTMLSSIEEVIDATPIIDASDVTLEYNATSGEIAYTVNNAVVGTTLSGATTAEWISNIIVGADAVTFTTTANEGNEDRTATITLSYTGAEDKTVTVTQKHFVADYATLPFEFNSGKADIANTAGLSQSGLGSDYADSNAPLKFDGTGDYVILKINERPGTLTFDIKNNSFSGGTFKVQTSEDGETYTDLETYTVITGTQNEEFKNLGENVRYIKWIYTNKSSGNVGLGNITLANYVAPADYNLTVALNNGISAIFVYNTAGENNPLIAEGAAGTVQVTAGTEIMVSPDVESGYVLESLMVDGVDVTTQIDNSGAYTFTMPDHAVTISATAVESVEPSSSTYVLATSITSGKHYIIVNQEASKAMGQQNSNNRAAADVIINDQTITVSSTDVHEFVIESATDGYSISDVVGGGYLYAASGSNNYLKTETELDENNNGIWTITFVEGGVASIVAQGTNSRNVMQYNSSSSLFACYGSASQKPVYLYEKVEVTVGSTGYTTYVTPAAVSFPEGVEAFIVTAINEGSMHMDPVDAVPAGTAVVVKAAQGTYTLSTATETVDVDDNLLLASDGTVKGGSNIYVLANKSKGVGFYPTATTINIPEGKAYLDTSATGHVKEFIAFDFGGTDAINAIDNGQLTVDSSVIYNVAGQRVGKMTKGIYVVNGKKVIVK